MNEFFFCFLCEDEEGTGDPEQLKKKSGGKGLLTNDHGAVTDYERDGDKSDLDDDSEEEFRKLDRDLAIKSKQHNLTSVHVRSIIHVGPAEHLTPEFC